MVCVVCLWSLDLLLFLLESPDARNVCMTPQNGERPLGLQSREMCMQIAIKSRIVMRPE